MPPSAIWVMVDIGLSVVGVVGGGWWVGWWVGWVGLRTQITGVASVPRGTRHSSARLGPR